VGQWVLRSQLSQLLLDCHRHIGVEVHPDDGACGVPVRDWLRQRPSPLGYPSRVVFGIFVDPAGPDLMLDNVGSEIGARQLQYRADQIGDGSLSPS
jgi:hypothetical protein